MAQIDLGKIKLTDEELSEKIIQTNGGVRLGKDADGKPGYVVTDAETGADTVVPFSSGGGGVDSLPIHGVICFAGTEVQSFQSGSRNNFVHIFERPIKISKITTIKTITSMQHWSTISYSHTAGIVKRCYSIACVKKTDGTYAYVTTVIANSTGAALNNIETEIPLSSIASYEELIGIGIQLYATSNNGSGSIITRIGYEYKPLENVMEYVIN